MLEVNDFFCGPGGIGIAFKQAGFNIVGAWDHNEWVVQSYRHNVAEARLMDIKEMTWEDVPPAHVWTFGFPCQDLALSGKHKGMIKGKTRSGMFYEIMRLLEETEENCPEYLPEIIMAENVMELKKVLPEVNRQYQLRGYKMYFAVYNSKYWGVPQNRKRYFVIGVHNSIDKEFTFPKEQTQFIPKLSSILEDNVDESYYMTPQEAKIIEPVPQGFKVYQATKQGYDIAVPGDAINIAFPSSKTRRGRVGKQVAQTIITICRQLVVEEKDGVYTVRKFTPREYARLQGFPESYELIAPQSDLYEQFGNSVTIPVVKGIAEVIKEFLT